MWRWIAAVTITFAMGVVMLVFPKTTTAKCLPCWDGGFHNHGSSGWRRKPPPPGHHKLTRLQKLALKRAEAARLAMRYIGTPYRWGGASPNGFDCSGLVAFVMSRVGIHVPHSSWAQLHLGVSVQKRQIKAGDVLFFNYGGHVALALNHNHYIESPHSGANVRVMLLTKQSYAIRRFTQTD